MDDETFRAEIRGRLLALEMLAAGGLKTAPKQFGHNAVTRAEELIALERSMRSERGEGGDILDAEIAAAKRALEHIHEMWLDPFYSPPATG